MPTGYTADISKGITFKQYLFACARAFGALVTMRDEDHDAKIPDEFKPTDYHVKEVAKAKRLLLTLRKMTVKEANVASVKEHAQKVLDNLNSIKKALTLKKKYEEMLAHVLNWRAPSPDHEDLKTFMAKQIRESIDFDCSTKYYEETPTLESGKEWLEAWIDSYENDIKYHECENAKEVERCKERTKWVQQLKSSIK